MELHACPVRLFTPEIEAWLGLFALTHELRSAGPGVVRYERVALPVAGGVADQPARTLEALNVIRHAWNGYIAERLEPAGVA